MGSVRTRVTSSCLIAPEAGALAGSPEQRPGFQSLVATQGLSEMSLEAHSEKTLREEQGI